jgi:hypothetical protein
VLAARFSGNPAAIINPDTGEPYNDTGAMAQLSKLLGFADPFEFDAGKYADRRLTESEAALKSYLARQAAIAGGATGGTTTPAPSGGGSDPFGLGG